MIHRAALTVVAMIACAIGCGGSTTTAPTTDAATDAAGDAPVDTASDGVAGEVGPGGNCATSAQCAPGLSCIDLAMFPAGGTCTSAGKACSKVCTDDTECASLTGGTFKCFAGCPGNPKFCGRTS